MKKMWMNLAATGALALSTGAAHANNYQCPVVSGAAESDAGTIGTLQNLGQVAIGRTASRDVNLHAGVIPSYLTELSGGLLGDMNCDGLISVSDIAPFVLALTNPAEYALQFPDCNILNADLNGSGDISVSDIAGFVALLTGG